MKKLLHSAAKGATRQQAIDVLTQQMLDVEILRKMVAEAEAEQLAGPRSASSVDDVLRLRAN